MNNKYRFTILSILLIILTFFELSTAIKYTVPTELTNYMTTREMRYHHFLWHNLRNLWNKLDNATRDRIRKLGWEPPRPALRYESSGNTYYVMEDNNSGEDFLYMHHHMVLEANSILGKLNPPSQVDSFKSVPAPGDKLYPALPAYTFPGLNNINKKVAELKSDKFYWEKIKPTEDKFKDPNYLRTLTLGQLGAKIEFTVHNWMHTRFSQKVAEIRPRTTDVMPFIDKKFDDPNYDWLEDSYSSHVHPLFWKIHGWVDDRVEDWKRANGIKTIQWKGTWTGGPFSTINKMLDIGSQGSGHSGHMDHNMRMMEQNKNIDVMEEVAKEILNTGECFYYHCYTLDIDL